MIGTWTSKQEEENQESSDDKETDSISDSMMHKTFYHTCIWVASSFVT